MKNLLLMGVLYGILTSCATAKQAPPVLSKSAQKKEQLKSCVVDFLHEEVGPKSSLGICEAIYRRRR